MNKKIILALFTLAIINQADACLPTNALLQSNFLQENKSYILGAAAIATVAILTYLYFTQPVFTQPINSLDNYKKLVNKTFDDNKDIINFIDHFSPPEDLLLDLIKEQNNFTDKQKEIFKNYGGFWSKNKQLHTKVGNLLTRVVCAKRMQTIINKNNFTTIAVPKKYIFLSNDGNNIVCFADKITPNPNQKIKIGLSQMKELAEIVDITGFTDFSSANWIIDSNNKIVFIDTEIRSFSLPHPKPHEKPKTFILERLKMHVEAENITTAEAIEYLDAKILNYKQTDEKRNKVLPSMNEFDEKNLNLAKIYPALRKWNKSKKNAESTYWDKCEYDKEIK